MHTVGLCCILNIKTLFCAGGNILFFDNLYMSTK